MTLLFTLFVQAIQVFVKSLLNLRPPRSELMVNFLSPEPAMLKRLNEFLKTNAHVNTLKQNVNILNHLIAADDNRESKTGVESVKALHHAAGSPMSVLQSPKKAPPSIDVAAPLSIQAQVTALNTAYGQGLWMWGFGRSTHGGVRLLMRRAEHPETYHGGMLTAATAVAIVRAVAGIGWRGEVNIVGLRLKNEYVPVATVESLVGRLQELNKQGQENPDKPPPHASLVVRPLLSQRNKYEGVLFQRKMNVTGFTSPSGHTHTHTPPPTTSKSKRRHSAGSRQEAEKQKVQHRRTVEPVERARDYHMEFERIALECRHAILGLNFGQQRVLGRKLKKCLQRFLTCIREFAAARQGGRYSKSDTNTKVCNAAGNKVQQLQYSLEFQAVEIVVLQIVAFSMFFICVKSFVCHHLFFLFWTICQVGTLKKLSKYIDEELKDMLGYFDKALSKLSAFYSEGHFIGKLIVVC